MTREYYQKHRAERLAYQRRYDAERRHGYKVCLLQGIPGVPALSPEEIEQRWRDHGRVVIKDQNQYCMRCERKLEADKKAHPEKYVGCTEPQSLEDFKRSMRNLGRRLKRKDALDTSVHPVAGG
jgi:hypothetical protein